jgi:hypothetical protein
MTAPDLRAIAQALGGEVHGDTALVPGPGHSRSDRSLSLRIGANGRIIWHSFAGDRWDDVRSHLERAGLPFGSGEPRACEPSAAERESFRQSVERAEWWAQKKRQIALRLWNTATDAGNSLVERYLQFRGIRRAPPPSLRFAADLNWKPLDWRPPEGAVFSGPAMLAKIEAASGAFLSVQATWLARGGNGKCSLAPTDRKFIGATKGGRVMLDAAAPEMIVGEGVETVLSASDALDLPCIAALNAGGLAHFQPPPGVVRLVVAYDNDRAGRDAANKLAARMYRVGVMCRMAKPPGGHKDWNDAAQAGEHLRSAH